MALVTWTCGHKSRIIGTQKGRAKYMVCRECYEAQQAQPAAPATEQEKAEMIEQAEAAAAMSEIQSY